MSDAQDSIEQMKQRALQFAMDAAVLETDRHVIAMKLAEHDSKVAFAKAKLAAINAEIALLESQRDS